MQGRHKKLFLGSLRASRAIKKSAKTSITLGLLYRFKSQLRSPISSLLSDKYIKTPSDERLREYVRFVALNTCVVKIQIVNKVHFLANFC